jgi:Fur family transcriptional regulator, ferric uptake regulator
MEWAENQLKQAGLRITQHRKDVLDWLRDQGKPVTLLELNRFFSAQINRITLYRILNDLAEAGMLKMFYGQDGHKYIEEGFQITKGVEHEEHGHVHFQCNSCDEVFCLDNVEVKNLPQGFNISPAQSILIGLCERCH